MFCLLVFILFSNYLLVLWITPLLKCAMQIKLSCKVVLKGVCFKTDWFMFWFVWLASKDTECSFRYRIVFENPRIWNLFSGKNWYSFLQFHVLSFSACVTGNQSWNSGAFLVVFVSARCPDGLLWDSACHLLLWPHRQDLWCQEWRTDSGGRSQGVRNRTRRTKSTTRKTFTYCQDPKVNNKQYFSIVPLVTIYSFLLCHVVFCHFKGYIHLLYSLYLSGIEAISYVEFQ